MAVDFKFTGDAGQLAGEYDKLGKKVEQLERKNKKLVDQAKRADKEERDAAKGRAAATQQALGGIQNQIAGYISLQGAINVVNTSLAEQRRLAEEAAVAQIRIAGSQASVLKNIGDVSDEDAKKFLGRVDALRAEVGFSSVTPLNNAASGILSATGGDQEKTLEILRAAAPLFRDSPDQLPVFASAMGDVMKSTGIDDAGRASALMLAIQGQARFEDLAAFKEVAPVLSAADVVSGGAGETQEDKLRDAREAAAAFAAIGSTAGDVGGSQTKTATSNLLARLRDVTRGAGAPADIDTFRERLDFVRSKPELQEELLKSGFEGAIKPIVESFVSDTDSLTSRTFEDALSKIQASDEAYARKIGQLANLTPELTTMSLKSAAEGNIEEKQRSSTLATPRQVLATTLEQSRGEGILSQSLGGGYFSDKLELMVFDAAVGMGTDPAEAAADRLAERQRNLRENPWAVGSPQMETADLSPELRSQVELLQKQEALLRELVDATKKANASTPSPTPSLPYKARAEANNLQE